MLWGWGEDDLEQERANGEGEGDGALIGGGDDGLKLKRDSLSTAMLQSAILVVTELSYGGSINAAHSYH